MQSGERERGRKDRQRQRTIIELLPNLNVGGAKRQEAKAVRERNKRRHSVSNIWSEAALFPLTIRRNSGRSVDGWPPQGRARPPPSRNRAKRQGAKGNGITERAHRRPRAIAKDLARSSRSHTHASMCATRDSST